MKVLNALALALLVIASFTALLTTGAHVDADAEWVNADIVADHASATTRATFVDATLIDTPPASAAVVADASDNDEEADVSTVRFMSSTNAAQEVRAYMRGGAPKRPAAKGKGKGKGAAKKPTKSKAKAPAKHTPKQKSKPGKAHASKGKSKASSKAKGSKAHGGKASTKGQGKGKGSGKGSGKAAGSKGQGKGKAGHKATGGAAAKHSKGHGGAKAKGKAKGGAASKGAAAKKSAGHAGGKGKGKANGKANGKAKAPGSKGDGKAAHAKGKGPKAHAKGKGSANAKANAKGSKATGSKAALKTPKKDKTKAKSKTANGAAKGKAKAKGKANAKANAKGNAKSKNAKAKGANAKGKGKEAKAKAKAAKEPTAHAEEPSANNVDAAMKLLGGDDHGKATSSPPLTQNRGLTGSSPPPTKAAGATPPAETKTPPPTTTPPPETKTPPPPTTSAGTTPPADDSTAPCCLPGAYFFVELDSASQSESVSVADVNADADTTTSASRMYVDANGKPCRKCGHDTADAKSAWDQSAGKCTTEGCDLKGKKQFTKAPGDPEQKRTPADIAAQAHEEKKADYDRDLIAHNANVAAREAAHTASQAGSRMPPSTADEYAARQSAHQQHMADLGAGRGTVLPARNDAHRAALQGIANRNGGRPEDYEKVVSRAHHDTGGAMETHAYRRKGTNEVIEPKLKWNASNLSVPLSQNPFAAPTTPKPVAPIDPGPAPVYNL